MAANAGSASTPRAIADTKASRVRAILSGDTDVRSDKNRPRPGIQIVDMVQDRAAVPTKRGATSRLPHPLEPARTDAEIECRLIGREKRTSLLRKRCTFNFIVHRDTPYKDMREFKGANLPRRHRLSRTTCQKRFEFHEPAKSNLHHLKRSAVFCYVS